MLGTMKSPEAQRLLTSYVDDLVAGKIAPAVQIDLVDAAQSSGSAPLQAKLDGYAKAKAPTALAAAFREALTRGGDVQRGQQVFAENAAAGCPRCHAVYGQGSDVGPDLSRIGGDAVPRTARAVAARAERADRSGIRDRRRHAAQWTADRRHADARRPAPTSWSSPARRRPSSASRRPRSPSARTPISAMPPMGPMLKPRELRDLVEFLSVLK